MTSTLILNIAVTLVFVYLVLGIMITGINETLFTLTRARGRYLKKAIDNLFYDDEWKEIAPKIGDSPFINVLKNADNKFPAAIPVASLTAALLSVIGNGDTNIDNIRKVVEKKKNKGDLYSMLSSILSDRGLRMDELRARIDEIFGGAMQRVSAWYKRNAFLFSLGFALLVASLLNIDTIDITTGLWKNREQAEKLAAFVNVASKEIKENDKGEIILQDGIDTLAKISHVAVKAPSVAADNLSDAGSSMLNSQVTEIRQSYDILADLGIPMGWTQKNMPAAQGFWDKSLLWMIKILGILLTAFATSLGAPFWFDLLKKITGIKKS
jgi:hypothetical protein